MMVKLDITKEQFHDVVTSLENKINVLESKCEEQTESTKQQITEMNKKIEIGSEHIHDVLTPRHERIDIESKEVEPTNERRSICNFIKGLVESSTVHGLPRLTMKGKIWRTFWGILLIGALGVSVLQIVGLFGSYFEYPVYVDVIPHSANPTFPQITVCLSSPYKRSAVIRHPIIENISNVDRGYYEDILKLISELPEQERIQLGYEASEVLKAVYFKEGKSPRVMTPSLLNHPYEGNCYVINPPMGTKVVEFQFNGNVDTRLKYPYGNEIGYALLNQQGLDPFHSEQQNRIILKPYTSFSSTFRLDVYSRLNGMYGGCQDNEDLFQQRTGFNYTREVCLKECRLKNAQMKCGCVHRYLTIRFGLKVPGLSNMRNCSSFDLNSCYYNEYNTLKFCQCKDKCIESVYTFQTALEQMVKPNVRYISRLFNVGPGFNYVEWARRSFAHFKLKTTENRYKEFKQQPLYPPSRFMSDLGGTLGFYLGASVLTLFELIHMLSGLIVFIFKRRTTE